jgi:predicted metal-binding membrane protein
MQLNGVESLRDWGEMTVAMMLPLAVIPARFVAFNSFWHRRYRAMAGFTAGFLGLWLMAGSLAMAFSLLLDRMGLQNPTTTAGMFLLAMVWQRTPLKVSAVRNCHRTAVLAPAGWRAELGCLRFGLSYGIQCVLSCWALMLLSATAEHQPLIMACLTVLMLFERSQWLSDKPILSRLPLLMLVWLVLH